MKIERQVCNIDQYKKLIQLGITKNKSYLTWLEVAEYDEMGSKIIEWHPCLFYEHKGDYECCYCPVSTEVVSNDDEFMETKGNYPAFTVAELGVMIPAWHFTYPRSKGFASYKNEDGLFAVADGTVNGQNYDTEAECRAALVIYLIENNILSVKTCNSILAE